MPRGRSSCWTPRIRWASRCAPCGPASASRTTGTSSWPGPASPRGTRSRCATSRAASASSSTRSSSASRASPSPPGDHVHSHNLGYVANDATAVAGGLAPVPTRATDSFEGYLRADGRVRHQELHRRRVQRQLLGHRRAPHRRRLPIRGRRRPGGGARRAGLRARRRRGRVHARHGLRHGRGERGGGEPPARHRGLRAASERGGRAARGARAAR